MDILRDIVSTLPLDVRALCREIAAAGPRKERTNFGAATGLTNPAGRVKKVRQPPASCTHLVGSEEPLNQGQKRASCA